VKLLLDEMLSPAIARELRSRGHEVLALARAEHRAVVTNNLRDFRPLHHEAITPGGAGHFGMIFMPGSYRRTKADTGRIIAALEAILSEHTGETDLVNGEAWL